MFTNSEFRILNSEFDVLRGDCNLVMKLRMLSSDDKLNEIRRLYFAATRDTIAADLAKALDLLKSMASEDERERATVYMEGLAQMRSDWARQRKQRKSKPRS
ncbi:MAG: hypothetical protein DMF98_22335 [Acidobacteria bacterium]|nr:MAG: hypothetical protein DMF98_22335 [Acidobacteriota bacterium]